MDLSIMRALQFVIKLIESEGQMVETPFEENVKVLANELDDYLRKE